MGGGRRDQLTDCAECWRLEERGKGKRKQRTESITLREEERGKHWHAKTVKRVLEKIRKREKEAWIRQ